MPRWHERSGSPEHFTWLRRDSFTVKPEWILLKSDKCMNTCTLSPSSPNTLDFPPFYQENLAYIYRFVYVQVRNREVAEDLTSQVFLKAVRHFDDQHSSQSIQSWLLQLARTTISDYWRAIQHTPTASPELLLEGDWEILTPEANNSPEEHIRRILQQLPEQYREVLVYRFLLKYTMSEVALVMRVTESDVKRLQFRALERAASLETAMVGGV